MKRWHVMRQTVSIVKNLHMLEREHKVCLVVGEFLVETILLLCIYAGMWVWTYTTQTSRKFLLQNSQMGRTFSNFPLMRAESEEEHFQIFIFVFLKDIYVLPAPSRCSEILTLICEEWGRHRRRIKTEEKAKVVASVWGQEFIKFLAALAVLPRTILNNNNNFE